MRDHTGEQWLPVAEAAERAEVKRGTVYAWIHRRKVRAHRISGRAYVAMTDVWRAEAATRTLPDSAPR